MASGFIQRFKGRILAESFFMRSGTATAASAAATLNMISGTITSEALTTASSTDYTLTLTNSQIAAGDHVFASVSNGTNTGGELVVGAITPAGGSATIVARNVGTTALNGTIKIAFAVIKA